MADDHKITSLVDRLNARAKEQQEFSAHMDRIKAAIPILVDTVYRLRREVPGITQAEVASSLAMAAEEVGGGGATDGWPDDAA